MKLWSSIMVRLKMWQLCRLIGHIHSLEGDSLSQDKSVDELITKETNSELKSDLQETKNRLLRNERETLRRLREKAISIAEEVKATEVGIQMLLTNERTAEFFHAQDKHIVPSEPSKDVKAMFLAFQFSWKIVKGGILLTVLSFGLAQLFSIAKIPTFFAMEKISIIFLAITLLALVIHSLISIVSSFAVNKAKSVWSFMKTLIFEIILIALCLLFLYGLLSTLQK